MVPGGTKGMTSVTSALSKAAKAIFRSLGYELIPSPMNAWYEQRLTLGKHLMQVFDRCRINCVIDVGAHYGEYGAFLREIGYTGRLISFEPVRRNFEQLRKRSVQDAHWQVNNMALGGADTTAEIKVFHETELSSFLTPNDYCAEHMGNKDLIAGTEQVQVKTVDSVFGQCVDGIEEPRVFLKLDTQGYDLTVLQKATGHLDRIQGLQCELSVKPIYEAMPSYLDALPRMCEMGFEVTGLFPVNRDSSFRVIELDCVMLRVASAGNDARAAHLKIGATHQ